LKNIACVLILFFLLTGFTSYRGYQNFPEPLPTTEGQLIYEEMGCIMCHGHQGMGDGFLAEGLKPKPRNFSSYEEMNRVPYQSMYSAIKNGIADTGMPSFSLSDKQIDDVIFYVRTFLTENYITINTCVNTPQVVSLDNVNIEGHFNIEVDKENLVLTNIKEGELTLTPNFIPLLKTYKKKRTKLVRVHINLTQGENDDKRYLAMVALRISDCLR
jgi:hypothetical protein